MSRGWKCSLVLCGLVLTGSGNLVTCAPSGAEPLDRQTEPEWEELSFDELIARLPVAGQDRVWNEERSDWIEHPASVELGLRIQKSGLTRDQWQAALRAARVVATHERWPKERPYEVAIQPPAWLEWPVTFGVKFHGEKVEQQVMLAGLCALGDEVEEQRAAHVALGPTLATSGIVELDFRVECWPHLAREIGWTGVLTQPVRLVPDEASAVDPIEDPALDRAVREAMKVSIFESRAAPGKSALRVILTRTPALEPYLRQHAVRASVEILNSGEVAEEFVVDFNQSHPSPSYIAYASDKLTASQLNDESVRSRMTIRVTGSAAIAFEDLTRDTYWKGSFEVPLGDLVEQQP